MKNITCKEMGGICDAVISAETAEEMGKKGKEHVHSVDDDAHKALIEKMEAISKEERAAWFKELAAKFEAAPDA